MATLAVIIDPISTKVPMCPMMPNIATSGKTLGPTGWPGTGGSDGAAYLMTTLNQPLFPDLWAIRAEL